MRSLEGIIIVVLIWAKPMYGFAQWNIIEKDTTFGTSSMDFLNKDTGFVIGYTQSNNSLLLKTIDGGQTWDSTVFTNWLIPTIHFPNKDTGYIAGTNFAVFPYKTGVHRTVDGGNTWQLVNSNAGNGNSNLSTRFFTGKKGIISTSGEAWSTNDAGVTWDSISNYPGGGLPCASINDGMYYATSGGGIVYSQDSLATYDTALRTWAYFSSLGVDFDGDSTFFVTGTGGQGQSFGYSNFNFGVIAKSTDLGNTWIDYHILETGLMGTIEIAPNSVYAGTSPLINGASFLKSVDGGITWFRQGYTGPFLYYLPYPTVIECFNDSLCYAISVGGIIFKTTNGGGPLLGQIGFQYTGVEDENSFTENEFSIYPNPNNGNFTLSIPEHINSEIKISVHDLRGRLIYTNTSKTSSGQIPVNIEKAEPGMYIVNVETPEQVSTLHIIKHK